MASPLPGNVGVSLTTRLPLLHMLHVPVSRSRCRRSKQADCVSSQLNRRTHPLDIDKAHHQSVTFVTVTATSNPAVLEPSSVASTVTW